MTTPNIRVFPSPGPLVEVSLWVKAHPVPLAIAKGWESLATDGLFWGIPLMLVLLLPWVRRSSVSSLALQHPAMVWIGLWLTWSCWFSLPAFSLWSLFTPNGGTMCFPPHREAFALATALAFPLALAHIYWLWRKPVNKPASGRSLLWALFVALPLLPALLSFAISLAILFVLAPSTGGLTPATSSEQSDRP